MNVDLCTTGALAELMGPDADELDAVALREFLLGIVDDTDDCDAATWQIALEAAAQDVLRLDPVSLDAGKLVVMRGGINGHALCELDPDNYPAGITPRLQPHYDALVAWAENQGLMP